MSRYFTLLLTILLPLLGCAITVEEVPNVHVANRNLYVSDPSGILSPSTVSELNSRISSIWKNSSAEVVVVIVDKIDDSMTPEEFATALFEKWGLGKSDTDNGLLFLVSRDDRAAQIRTGYGLEGILPDILAGRILRNDVFPLFREGDYDGGVQAGVEKISEILLNPEAAKEIASKYENDARHEEDIHDPFTIYLWLSLIIAIGLLVYVLSQAAATHKMNDVDRWRTLNRLVQPSLMIGCATLGMGLIPFFILKGIMNKTRRHKRDCPHCGHNMQLVDEEHDNDYLSPSQDLEEKLNSVDYDVWRCPQCAQTDIYPYINRTSPYTECPRCHTRAMSVIDRRILRQPTTSREGEGVDISVCRACGYRGEKRFSIPKKVDDSALVAGAVIGSALGGRGGGGGFGGGFGGSFGGGNTGGGGAGGNW